MISHDDDERAPRRKPVQLRQLFVNPLEHGRPLLGLPAVGVPHLVGVADVQVRQPRRLRGLARGSHAAERPHIALVVRTAQRGLRQRGVGELRQSAAGDPHAGGPQGLEHRGLPLQVQRRDRVVELDQLRQLPRLGVALRVARHPRQARARAGAESRHRGDGGARRACGDGPVVGLVAQQCAQIRTVSDAHPKVPVTKAVNQRHDHTVGLGNPQGDAQGLRIMVDPRGDRMPYRRADRRQHGGQVQRPAAYGVAPPVAIPNGRYRLQQFVHARDFSVHVFHSSTVRRKRTRLGGILGMIVRYHGRLDFSTAPFRPFAPCGWPKHRLGNGTYGTSHHDSSGL